MITRLSHGLGASISATLANSISVSSCTEDETKKVVGYMEFGYYLGIAIGPPLSSFLYYYFGYSIPFVFCSIMTFGCLFFIYILDNKHDESNEEYEEINFFKILFNPVFKIKNILNYQFFIIIY